LKLCQLKAQRTKSVGAVRDFFIGRNEQLVAACDSLDRTGYLVDIGQVNLIQEVKVLHLQFFHCVAPQGLIDGYLRFHMESPDLVRASTGELRTVDVIIRKRLDALGIEPWLRVGSKRHLLSRKLLLIAYLAECDAAHPEFRRTVNGRIRSLGRLCMSALSAVGHLLRGRLQKAFYGLL
jgi:hypothetical protein